MNCTHDTLPLGRVDNAVIQKAIRGQAHAILLTTVRFGNAPDEIDIVVANEAGLLQAPQLTYRSEGGCGPGTTMLQLEGTQQRFTGTIRALPRAVDVTYHVSGRTAQGKPASAVEQFSLARIGPNEDIMVVGPHGHVVMHFSPVPAAGTIRVSIGPPGIRILAAPDGKAMVDAAYRISTPADVDFPYPVPTEFRLPLAAGRGADPRFERRTLALFRWDEIEAQWELVPSVAHPPPRNMVTARITRPGVYAVFGALRSEHLVAIGTTGGRRLGIEDAAPHRALLFPDQQRQSEFFQLVNLDGGAIALRAQNGLFLSVQDQSRVIAATAGEIGDAEAFALFIQADGSEQLRTAGGLPVGVEQGSDLLLAGTKLAHSLHFTFVGEFPGLGEPNADPRST